MSLHFGGGKIPNQRRGGGFSEEGNGGKDRCSTV